MNKEQLAFICFLINHFNKKLLNDTTAQIGESGLNAKQYIEKQMKELFDTELKFN